MFNFLKNNKKGQLLIEAMVAMTIIVVAILGALTLVSNALGYNKTASQVFTATYLASEGIEIVKNIVDANVRTGAAFNEGLDRNKCYEVDFDSVAMGPSLGGCNFNNNFSNTSLNYDSGTGEYSYNPGGTPTVFKRTIKINYLPANPNEIHVKSIVRWVGRGGIEYTHVVLEDYFYNFW